MIKIVDNHDEQVVMLYNQTLLHNKIMLSGTSVLGMCPSLDKSVN